MKSTVTVGLCVRNCEDFIKEAIDSIIDQDFAHELMDLIIVDGNSEDKTLSILKQNLEKTSLKHKIFWENKGLGRARQIVVDNASGDYIIWVDGDMILPKNHIRKQVEFMDKNSQVGIAIARHGQIDGENIVAVLENILFRVYDSKSELADSRLPGTGGSVYRVKAIRQVGGFDDEIKGAGEDLDAAFRIKEGGWLLKQGSALYYERRAQTWEGVWRKWFGYGFGLYDLYCKNRGVFSLFRMNPLAGVINGFLRIADAYKLIRRKYVILLPFHFAFEMTAWCIGFTNGSVKKGLQKTT